MIVGEVALQDLHRVVAYLEYGDQLHLAHNFVFIDQAWDAETLRDLDRRLRGAGRGDGLARVVPGQPRQAPPRQPLRPRRARRAARARDPGDDLRAARARRSSTRARSSACRTRAIPPDRIVDVDGRDPERAPIPWTPRRARLRLHHRRAVAPVRRRGAHAQRGHPGRTTRTRRSASRARSRDCARERRRCRPATQKLFDAGPGILAWTRETHDAVRRRQLHRRGAAAGRRGRARALQRPRPRGGERLARAERGAHPASWLLSGEGLAGVGVEEVHLRGVDPDLGRLAGLGPASASRRATTTASPSRRSRRCRPGPPSGVHLRAARTSLGLDAEVDVVLRAHRLDEVELGVERRAPALDLGRDRAASSKSSGRMPAMTFLLRRCGRSARGRPAAA